MPVSLVGNSLETCLPVSILSIYIVLFILILFFGLFFSAYETGQLHEGDIILEVRSSTWLVHLGCVNKFFPTREHLEGTRVMLIGFFQAGEVMEVVLKVTAGQQTLSGLICNLTGHKLHSLVKLTGHNYSHSWTKSQILTFVSLEEAMPILSPLEAL